MTFHERVLVHRVVIGIRTTLAGYYRIYKDGAKNQPLCLVLGGVGKVTCAPPKHPCIHPSTTPPKTTEIWLCPGGKLKGNRPTHHICIHVQNSKCPFVFSQFVPGPGISWGMQNRRKWMIKNVHEGGLATWCGSRSTASACFRDIHDARACHGVLAPNL